MASNDVTKAAAALIADLVARTAASRGMTAPERATTISRRPPPTMPNLSPRGVQLMDAIIAARRPPPTPNTASGGGQVGPGGGVAGPGMFPDRSSMYAQNPNVRFQQTTPTQAQPTSEPTDPIQRYALGLPPMDANGNIPPNWDQLSPQDREAIWQSVAQAQGIDLAQESPQYQSLPNLRTRGIPGSPDQQTRQYAAPLPDLREQFQPSLTPSSPAMNNAAFADRVQSELADTSSPEVRRRGPENIGTADPYGTIPPGLTMTSDQWMKLTPEQKRVAWESAGLPNGNPAIRASPEQQAATPPPESGIAPEQWAQMTDEQKSAAWAVYYDPSIADAPGIGDIERSIQGVTIPVVETIERNTPQAIQEFLTYDPFQDTDPGRAIARRTDLATNAAIELSGWLENQNQMQIADGAYYMITHEGEMPSDWGDYGTYISRLLAGNALVPNKLSSIDYLREHTELWDEAAAAYEAAEAAEPGSGSEGLIAWYEQEVGPWWAEASHVALDPLNLALPLAVPSRQLARRAAARTVNEGTQVSQTTRNLYRASKVLGAAADPISAPVEAVLGRLGPWVRRIPGTGPGGQAERQIARETIEEAESTAAELGGRGTEEEFVRAKTARAEEDIRTKQAADAEVARVQAIRDERAAEAEIRRAIREGDTKRATELRQREAVAKKNREAEVREAAKRDARREEVRRLEDERQAKIAKAEVARKQQIRTASTPRGRESALARHEAKLETIRIDYEKKVAAWERKHGAVYADEVADLGDELTAAAPEPVRETTVFEEERPGSNIDSVDQRRAEDDDAILRAQERRAARESPVAEPDVAPTTAAGRMVPLEERMPTQTDRISRPGEVSDFQAEARRRIEEDYAPIDTALDAGRNQRANRAMHDVEFQSNLETLYRDTFGGSSNYTPEGLFRKYSAGTEEGAIARFVFGTPDEARVAWGQLERFATGNSRVAGHIRTRMDDLVSYRNRVHGDADVITSGPSTITPSREAVERATATPLPEPAAGATDPSVTRFVDDYRDDILSADPDVSRTAAAEAHKSVSVNFKTPALRKQANDAINDLRNQSGHPRRGKKPPSASGIVFDPHDAAEQLAEKTRAAVGRVGKPVERILPGPNPAKAAGSITIPGHVKYADELKDAIRRKVGVTERQVKVMTTQYELPIGTGKNAKTISTNYWDRLQDNLIDNQRAWRKDIDRNGWPTSDEGADALRAKMVTAEEEAYRRTNDEFSRLFRNPDKAAAMKAARSAYNFANPRARLQFNIVTGPRAIVNDVLTNQKLTILSGQAGASRRYPRLLKAIVKDADEAIDLLTEHALYERVRGAGIKSLPKELSPTIGREEVERTLTRRTALNPLNATDSYHIRRIRGGNDTASRHAIYINYFDGHLLEEQAKFLDFVRGKVRKSGNTDLFDEVAKVVRTGNFDADDIRAATRAFGPDDSYARTWAKQVDDLSQAALKKQRQIMFSYKKTKMDDKLGKVFLFHYYMTRSTALYTKLMIQHPQLIGIESFIWERSRENLKKFPGHPTWMDGFMGFALDNGHVLYTNPTMLVSGIGVLQAMGDRGFSSSAIEEALAMSGLFPQPLVRAALAVVGAGFPGDPTGTTQIRRAVNAIFDEIRFSDFGRSQGWDEWLGGKPIPDFVQDVTNGIVDMANKVAREVSPQLEDFDAANTQDVKMQQVKATMISNFQEEGGSENVEDWPEDVQERYWTALMALEDGVPNDDVDAAIEEYTRMNTTQVGANMVSPTGAYIRDSDADARNEAEREAGRTDYRRRSDIEEARVGTNDIENIQSSEGIALAAGMQRYNNAGSDNEQNLSAGKNQIMFGVDDLPDYYQMTVGGATYTVAEVKAMSEDERRALANEWANEEATRVGMMTGASVNRFTDQPEANATRAREDEQAKIREEEPIVADYVDYRRYVLNAPDIRRLRSDIEASGSDTEFSRALDRQREFLLSQGETGEELETGLDRWMSSDEAYAAVMGYAWKHRGDTGRPIFSVTDPAPWREAEATGGSVAPEREEPITGEQIDEGLDFSTISARQAKALLREDAISPDGIEELVDRGVIDEPTLRDWLRDGTLLWDDLYQMAAQANLSATDLKYLREDGYLSNQDIIRLVVDASEESIAEIRRINRQRKRDKENKTGPYRPKRNSGDSGNSGFLDEYLLTPTG